MGMVKGEHFVPECYLRMFTNNGKLNVYDKFKKEIRKNQSVDKIAKQNAFYDFSEEELRQIKVGYPWIDDKQYIEKFFSNNIEAALKDCLDVLQPTNYSYGEDCIIQLDDSLKLHLSAQMAYQFLRTKGFQESLPQLEKTEKAFYQKLMLLDDNIVAQWANYFYHFSWIIAINDSNYPFYTSDNPVCIFDANHNILGLSALRSNGSIIICYPYSASVSVTLMKRVFGMPPSLFMRIQEKYLIDFQNALQYRNSQRNIFSQSSFENVVSLSSYSSFDNVPYSEKDNRRLDELNSMLFKQLSSGIVDVECLNKTNEELKKMCKRYGLQNESVIF